MKVGDLYVADGPLVLASGTELAKININEVVSIKIPPTALSAGNVYVVGLDSKQEQYIAETSLTEVQDQDTLAEKRALIIEQTPDTSEWDARQ